MKKKVLFCKIEAPMYSSDGMVQAFKNVGYDVIEFDWQNIRFGCGIDSMRLQLIQICQSQRPDVTFLHIQQSGIITKEVAQALSEDSFVINFTEDVRDDISWYEDLAPHIGLTIFSNRDDVRTMHERGFYNTAFMPTSFNNFWYKPQPKTNKYYGDIIFIGNNFINTNNKFEGSQHRYDMVQFMKKEFSERFKQYGLNWGEESVLFNPQKSVEAYNNCKVVITQNNFFREGYQSDRFFNAVGCGAFVVAQYFIGCEEQFEGKLTTWKTFEELKHLCMSALVNDEIRERKAKELHDYVMKYHTWTNRFEYLKTLINDDVQYTNQFRAEGSI